MNCLHKRERDRRSSCQVGVWIQGSTVCLVTRVLWCHRIWILRQVPATRPLTPDLYHVTWTAFQQQQHFFLLWRTHRIIESFQLNLVLSRFPTVCKNPNYNMHSRCWEELFSLYLSSVCTFSPNFIEGSLQCWNALLPWYLILAFFSFRAQVSKSRFWKQPDFLALLVLCIDDWCLWLL